MYFLERRRLMSRLVSHALLMITAAILTLSAQARVGNNEALADPNLASEDELAAIAHIDAALAEAIVAGRPYLTAAALDEALAGSLDADARTEVYGALFRQINLNTASEAEIMLIPGMTGRMAHEFEEYRPYTSLDQFRREMSKYVDDAEVARLEQYVFIPMNLNTASEDDFATIPGMTPRMIHEFEEYRPYTTMEQFRREMSKYVDDAEVARLESYVTLD
jgi:DNA uptake protein ComE-like DNA-binding protein